MATRKELIESIGARYREAGSSEKSAILDEFVAVTGYHRKHAIRVLGSRAQAAPPPRQPRHRLYDEAGKPALEKFRSDFKKRFNAEVQVTSPYAYDAVKVMVAAMVKAGSADPKVYLPVLAKTDGYEGVTGVISFDEKGDLKDGALTIYTFRGGQRTQIAVTR